MSGSDHAIFRQTKDRQQTNHSLNLQLFSYDALSSPTGAMKVSNAKPVMVCNMHLVINSSI